MREMWLSLSAADQDALVSLALLAPGLAMGAILMRGFAPWPLIGALLRRFAVANATFVALIAVSVALGVGMTAQERGLRQGSARATEKFDLILGAPGSETTLMLAAVYLQPSDVPLLSGASLAEVAATPGVTLAAPLAYGDSYLDAPVVGTIAGFVAHLSGDLSAGRLFEARDEAVAGAFAPVSLGEVITPAHGTGEAADTHAHEGGTITIVGRMAPTGSPWDRAILVPVEAVWHVHGLADGHAPGEGARIGPPFDPAYLPGTPAILVRADTLATIYRLRNEFTRPDMMAFFPGTVLAQLFGLMRDLRVAMSLLAGLTQLLVALSIMVGLMILTRVFARRMALLRAIGAPVRFVGAVVWGYAATLIGIGAVAGLGLGWVAAWAMSAVVTARTDILVRAVPGWTELQLVAGFVSLTLILALLPAIAAALRPVLSDLRG